MFIYLDTATPRLMLRLLLINVSRQGPMLMANVGCCVATLNFGGDGTPYLSPHCTNSIQYMELKSLRTSYDVMPLLPNLHMRLL